MQFGNAKLWHSSFMINKHGGKFLSLTDFFMNALQNYSVQIENFSSFMFNSFVAEENFKPLNEICEKFIIGNLRDCLKVGY